MREARSEISHWAEFDCIVVNEDFDTALKELKSIIDSTRDGREIRQSEQALLLAELLGSG
jgi:guanylate kinase